MVLGRGFGEPQGLLTCGCSGTRQGQDQSRSEPAPDTEPVKYEAFDGEDFPPILRTPWKGDLDEMVRRRVVRVLLPYRRPEFFFMDGRPVGILQEAFQEVERLLNNKYKTTAANRVVVALLPIP